MEATRTRVVVLKIVASMSVGFSCGCYDVQNTSRLVCDRVLHDLYKSGLCSAWGNALARATSIRRISQSEPRLHPLLGEARVEFD